VSKGVLWHEHMQRGGEKSKERDDDDDDAKVEYVYFHSSPFTPQPSHHALAEP
jgi:hypothetical protein